MKLLSTAPFFLCFALAARGQDIAPKDEERESVFSIIDEAEEEDTDPSVTMDISANSGLMNPAGAPLLVTGKPPENAEFLQPLEEPESAIPEPEGVIVRVEPGIADAPPFEASGVRLLAPFPAKPLFPPPAGWQLERPESVPPFIREVALDNGTRISLTIRPHLLVPQAEGDQAIAVSEPGYEAGLQYAQARTVGAILADSIERLDEDAVRLGEAIESLQQLLSSLPHPEDSSTDSNTPEP